MKYVGVFEYHKRGGLHAHLLVGGVDSQDLKLTDSGHTVRSGKTAGAKIYNVGAWSVGFSTATEVMDKEAVKSYISKYISKTGVDMRFFGKKRYFCSHNIKRPKVSKFSQSSKRFDIEAYFDLDRYDVAYEDVKSDYMVLNLRIND